jgi:hypothetical protein
MLFLGNSYTFQNELDQAVAEVFAAAGEPVVAARLAEAGWAFPDHVTAVETEGSAHAAAFAEAQDWVVLQDQSQIPGFPEGNPELAASRAAAVTLDGYAAATGAQTLFLMTWGRRDGDSTNAQRYPDFPTMQGYLDAGYLDYVARASEDGTPAWVAPAGRAWARVYADILDAGGEPLAEGSAFAGLYAQDGSHPSPRGTYLAALVIYSSITGRTPVGLEAPAAIDDAAYLQATAAAVVLAGEGITFPWTGSTPGDTGGDGDDGDSGGGRGDTETATGSAAPTPDCGCGAGASPAGWLGLPLGLAALLRRRA